MNPKHRRQLAIRIPAELRAELEAIAKAEERTITHYVVKAIEAYLERRRERDERRVPRGSENAE